MPKRIIDKVLIDDIINGNTNAFHWITDEYKDSILYHVFRIVKNKTVAEELTNIIFTKVFENLNLYKPRFKFNSWLYKIATNEAIDYLRNKKHNIVTDHSIDDIQETCYDDDNPESVLNQKENIATLLEAVDKLKPNYRRMIKLRYFEELSYEEISKRVNVPIGTVKATLHRAKQSLIKIIQNQIL